MDYLKSMVYPYSEPVIVLVVLQEVAEQSSQTVRMKLESFESCVCVCV
jgi:hypothetical protein